MKLGKSLTSQVLGLVLVFFTLMLIHLPRAQADCSGKLEAIKEKLKTATFPLEGSADDYAIFLDIGQDWCNDERVTLNGEMNHFCWRQEDYLPLTNSSGFLHLGLDIKFKTEKSTNQQDGTVNDGGITKFREVKAMLPGKACYINLGSTGSTEWGMAVAVQHEVDGCTFYTLYEHMENYFNTDHRCSEGADSGAWVETGTKIGEIKNLNNLSAHDRDHLHLALRINDLDMKCGGNESKHFIEKDPTGECLDPKDYIPIFSNMSKILSAAGPVSGFPDVPREAWYARAVYFMAKKKILQGYQNGLFGPGDPVTRAQFLKILFNSAFVSNGQSSVTVQTDPWYGAFYYLASRWTNPNNNNETIVHWLPSWELSSLPNQSGTMVKIDSQLTVSRALAASMMMNFFKLAPLTSTQEKQEYSFPDVDINSFAAPRIAAVKKAGIFTGNTDGTFAPNRNLNRAEAATILCRVFFKDACEAFNDF